MNSSAARSNSVAHHPRRRGRVAVVLALVAGLLPALVVAAATTASPAASAAPVAGAPMRMDVGPDSPLLLTQMNIGNDLGKTPGFKRNWNSGWSIGQLWASLPDDVKGNVGFVFHQGHTALSDQNPEMSAEWLEANVAEADKLGIPSFILWDEGRTLRTNPTRWDFLEHLYQSYPRFAGTVVSEQADTLGDLPEALRIANKYGGFHILGSLEETDGLVKALQDQAYWDKVVPYAQNFILNPKNFHENFESANSAAKGEWLAGVTDNWGPYFDGYPYYGCGIFGRRTDYNACGDRWSRSIGETVSSTMMLDQWQNGATVFHLENQLDVPTTGNLYSPYFYQSILPAFRYILEHGSPTRDEVVAQTPVAYSDAEGTVSELYDSTAAGRSGNPPRTTFYSMYEHTPALTAVQKSLWFYLRSSGRYGMIPRLPKLAPQSVVDRFDTVLTKTSYEQQGMAYGDARSEVLDAAYPAISEGDAFVQRSGSSWLAYNTNDRDNFNQDAAFDLAGSTFTRVEMPAITPHTWTTVDEGGDVLDLLVDNYRTDREKDLLAPGGRRDMEYNRNFVKYAYVPNPQDHELRTTTIKVDVTSKPTLTISGYDGNGYTYDENWNPNTHQYTLELHHNGVIDIRLTTKDDERGWTSTSANDAAVAKKGTSRELAFDGTSVAWQSPPTKQPATISIDGIPYARDVDLSQGGRVFRATGLSNGVHTLRIDGVPRVQGTFLHVPSVEQEVRSLETNDFSYGSAEDDEDTLYGSDGWRVIDGRLKLVGFVFPFYGDTTVYNTNAKLADLRYDATVTLVKGTSGALVFRANEDDKTGYHFRLDPSRTAEGRTGSATYSCSLMIDYGTTALATCPSSLTLLPDHPYQVSVVAQGNTITASIDGQQVLSYTASGSTVRGAGYTGLRAPQMQSDAGYRLGQFVELDDVTVTDLGSGGVVYRSGFDSWADAKGWMTETPLVFDWDSKPDPRSSFTFPWRWQTAGGTWQHQTTDAFTSGLSGTYRATADNGTTTGFSAVGGSESAWAKQGDYDAWSWLKVDQGDQAGLVVRAQGRRSYQARVDVTTGQVTLGRVMGSDSNDWKVLASGQASGLARERWFLVEVDTRGPLLTVLVNGQQMISVREDSFSAGAAGIWAAPGAVVDVDDARVIARPTTAASGPRPAATVVDPDGVSGRHITGYDQITVKTARTHQPDLPGTVVARFSDGTKEEVPVTWDAIPAPGLAVATAPTPDGPSRGTVTATGHVEGTDLAVKVPVTVMPNLVDPVVIDVTMSRDEPVIPDQVKGPVAFTDGTSTWTKVLYIRWDTAPDTSADAPDEQTITGTIGSWPWEKVTARITLKTEHEDLASGKPVTAYATLNASRNGAKMVDGNSGTGWYTGGFGDGAFSAGGPLQGSLCSWAYVDLGADTELGGYAIQFGENLTNWGSMFNAPYQVQVLTEAQAAAAGTQLRNSSVCTRTSGGSFGAGYVVPKAADVWTTVSSGTGTVDLATTQLDKPVTARYVRVFTNEPDTAHRYGTAVFDFQLYGPED